MWFWLAIISIIFVLFKIERNRLRISNRFKHIPGPKEYPFIGNILSIKINDVTDFSQILDSVCVAPIFKITFAGNLILGVSDPSTVQRILSGKEFLEKPYYFEFFKMKYGLISAKYTLWKPIRKATNVSLSHASVLGMIPVFNKHLDRLCSNLGDKLHQGTFNVEEVLVKFGIEQIFETMVGHQYSCSEKIKNAFQDVGVALIERALNPIYHPNFIYNMTKLSQKVNYSYDLLKEMCKPIVERRKKLLDISTHKRTFIDELIKMDKDGIKMLLIYILIIFIIIFLLRIELSRIRFNRKFKNIPGPPSYPIIGSALFFNPNDISDYAKLIDKVSFATKTKLSVFKQNVLVIREPSAVQKILSHHAFFEKPWQFTFFNLPYGLFSAFYPVWKPIRKVTNPAMSQSAVKNMLPVFNKHIDRLCVKIGQHVGRGSFDIENYFVKFGIEQIFETMVGHQFECSEKMKFAFQDALTAMIERLLNVFLYNDTLYKMSNKQKRIDETLKLLGDLFVPVIEERQKIYEDGNKNLLIDELISKHKEDKANWPIELLKENFISILLAVKYPLIGSILSIKINDVRDFVKILDLISIVPISKVTVAGNLGLFVRDPATVQQILSNKEFLEKPFYFDYFELKYGLFSAKYQIWKPIRKVCNNAMNQSGVLQMSPIFNRHIDQLCDKIHGKIGKGTFNIEENLVIFGIEQIFETMVGHQCQTSHELRSAFQDGSEALISRFLNVFYHPNIIFRFTNLRKKIDYGYEMLSKMFLPVIESRMRIMQEKSHYEKRLLLIDDLLEKHQQDKHLWPIEVLKENFMSIIFAVNFIFFDL
uniref:CSON015599 protein n=1 Tax=Culicoides sonorensis TaxID=179676 RepID=A0A336LPP6_CULSO